MSAPAVETRDLVVRYGDFTAVDHISFSVAPGEVFGFLGANGAGKTVFVTTHYMDEAEQCGRIGLMRDGRLVALDSPAGLKKSVFPEPVFEFDPLRSLSSSELSAYAAHEAFAFFESYGPRFHAAAAGPEAWARWAPELGKTFRIRPIAPSLEDVFVRVVEGRR